MQLKKLAVLRLDKLAPDHYWLELENNLTEKILPGQFLNFKIDPGLFLRRPFSVARADRAGIGILFKVKGVGTRLLAGKKKGDLIDVLGPLGNTYPIRKVWKTIWLAGGGTGIAPLLFLSGQLLKAGCRVTMLCGARSKDLLFPTLLPNGYCECGCATDDGTKGHKGSVLDLIEKKLKAGERLDVIYAGGPSVMLRRVADMAQKYGIPAYVSVENRMACGTGVCFGCVVKVKDGEGNWEHVRVCKDGPVFPAEKILWE